ncbi:CYTH domain-containing protein [Oscillospiraceae bacterium PP1C4]
MEIERKFLISSFPNLHLQEIEKALVKQGYLSIDPEVRIRSKKTSDSIEYVLCVKGDGTLSREEVECNISEDAFQRLEQMLDKPLISKDYRKYKLPGGLFLECNRVDAGTPSEFMYAEVEFSSVEQANAFIPPSYLEKEVTEDNQCKMKNYWKNKK